MPIFTNVLHLSAAHTYKLFYLSCKLGTNPSRRHEVYICLNERNVPKVSDCAILHEAHTSGTRVAPIDNSWYLIVCWLMCSTIVLRTHTKNFVFKQRTRQLSKFTFGIVYPEMPISKLFTQNKKLSSGDASIKVTALPSTQTYV